MKGNGTFVGSLAVSWLGTAASWSSDVRSIASALAAIASVVASCYAIAIARERLKKGLTTESAEVTKKKKGKRCGFKRQDAKTAKAREKVNRRSTRINADF